VSVDRHPDEVGDEPVPPPPPPASLPERSGTGPAPYAAPHAAPDSALYGALDGTVGPDGPRGVRRGRRALTVLVSLAVGFASGLAVADVVTIPELPWRNAAGSAASSESERDVALVALLEAIIASESIMLAFNDEVEDGLEGVTEEDVALAAIAVAAADGAGGLRAARPGLLVQTGDGVVDEIRNIYVPHLDAWIDYFVALSERPGLFFTREEQQPFLLLINSTAEAFADELEQLLDAGRSSEVAALAERILEDGFRSETPPDL